MQAETGITSAHCHHLTFTVSSLEQISRLIYHQYYGNEVAKELSEKKGIDVTDVILSARREKKKHHRDFCRTYVNEMSYQSVLEEKELPKGNNVF